MKAPPVLARAVGRGTTGIVGKRTAQLLPQAKLAGPMPWVMAIMVAMMTVAAAGGLGLNNLARATQSELAGGLTVQIVEASPQSRERQAAAAVNVLQGHPGVAEVRRVPTGQVEQLIQPWLGGGDDGQGIPVPALIDVRLTGDATARRIGELRDALARSAPAARIDAQSAWLRPVFSAIHSLQWLAFALIAMLGAATAAAVWLAARTALGANRDTIEIVHHLGATDRQIARIFQRSVAIDAALGGIVGLGLGIGAVLFLSGRFARLGSDMVGRGGLGLSDWLLIAAIPLCSMLLAMFTARFTVIAALRRML